MLAAGDLKTRGTLQRRVNVPDGKGGNVVTWTRVSTVWAQVVAKNGVEGVSADQQQPKVFYDITIRYRAGVVGSAFGADAAMRFVVGPRIFDIRSVVDLDEVHEALVLGCELYKP